MFFWSSKAGNFIYNVVWLVEKMTVHFTLICYKNSGRWPKTIKMKTKTKQEEISIERQKIWSTIKNFTSKSLEYSRLSRCFSLYWLVCDQTFPGVHQTKNLHLPANSSMCSITDERWLPQEMLLFIMRTFNFKLIYCLLKCKTVKF